MIGRTGVKSVNWHITARCNYRCKFCFSQNLDGEVTNLEEAKGILLYLRRMGMEKINFVGGEPTLHPLFFDFIMLAKEMGFVVSVVSNGYYLNRDIIFRLKPFVDWIGLSIDSAKEEVEVALGRGNGDGGHVKKIIELVEIVHELGINLKINTTVTRLNWTEDIRFLIKRLRPERWKIFQVLHIIGQNDRYFNELSITDEQFEHYKSINSDAMKSLVPVFEGSKEMLASYFMISPSGLAMSNIDGANRTFLPLSGISHNNISQIMDVQHYFGRDAIYQW